MHRVAALLPMLLIATTMQGIAASFTITYSGYVIDGWDQTGIFGQPLSPLNNLDFTATFTGSTDFIEGGSAINLPPATPATLTIDGATHSFDGAFYSYTKAYEDSTNTYLQSRAMDSFGGHAGVYNKINIGAVEAGFQGMFPSSLLSAFNIDLTGAGISAGGSFYYFQPNGEVLAYANLTPTSVAMEISAVPVPAAFPLFASVLAFAGLLGTIRKLST